MSICSHLQQTNFKNKTLFRDKRHCYCDESAMPLENVVDADGYGMLMSRTKRGSCIAPGFNEDTVDKFPEFKCREDDIFLCSYAKTGCHWVWEMVRLMVHGVHVHDHKVEKESFMVEVVTQEHLDNLASPRILNNHLFFDDQPKELLQKKVKVIYIYRNIKDIAVSFYHHHNSFREINKYEGPFNSYLRRFADGLVDSGGPVFEYMQDWDKALDQLGDQAFVLCYEDMKEDILSQLKSLAAFLGTSQDEELLKEIARLTDFSTMKVSKNFSSLPPLIDGNGNHKLYRKGQVGDWKNHFTVAQSEWYDQLIEEHCSKLKYHKFRYSLPK